MMMFYILMTCTLTGTSSKPSMHLYPWIHDFKSWIHLLFAPEDVLKVSVGEIRLRIQCSETSRHSK